MHAELKSVSSNMKNVGLGILAQAQYNALFGKFHYQLDEGLFAVLQSAHAAEILIKACIAEQHPLLIFSHLPKSNNVQNDLLDIKALFEKGKTVQYNELPEKLWASTGYKIEKPNVYDKFGDLRNCIQHFHVPSNVDFAQKSIEFIYEVIDPLLNHFWTLYAVDYCDGDRDLVERLVVMLSRGVEPKIRNEMAADLQKAQQICHEIYEDD